MFVVPKVKFGDVVKEVKNKIDRNNNPYEYYVAGDHMDSEDLTIHRRGCFATDDVGPAFIREFRKGQVLYGSRRTYLKKVAVADFDGVTANTTFVLETKDQNVLLQELLPFIMLTDNFTKWSIGKSKGSTNPYILFSDLADYEFDLPPIEEQRKLATVLWKMFRLKEGYVELQHQSDQLVQSQFIEMFGDQKTNPLNLPVSTLGNTCTFYTGTGFPNEYQGNTTAPYPFYKVGDISRNVQNGYKYLFDCENYVDFQIIELIRGAIIPEGTVVFAKIGEALRLNRRAITSQECLVDNNAMGIKPNEEILNIEYFFYFMKMLDMSDYSASTTLPSVRKSTLEAVSILVPKIETQKTFASFVQQFDKSKFVLQETLKYDKISYFSMIKSA